MKLPTTSLRQLHEAGACTARYRHLAKALGGIKKYGRDTPITLVQILDICGLDDLEWVGDSDFNCSLPVLHDMINEAQDKTQDAWEKVWEKLGPTGSAFKEIEEAALTASTKEEKKQTAKIRRYLVRGKI